MGTVTKLGQGLHLSISTLAAELGMTRETVARRLADAQLEPSGKRGGYAVYRLKSALPVLLAGAADGRVDPEKLDPFKRQAYYRGELDRLKLEQERRELIPRIEVEQEQARVLRALGATLDTLPDLIERDCAATPEQVRRLEKTIDEAREELYRELAQLEDEDGVRERA